MVFGLVVWVGVWVVFGLAFRWQLGWLLVDLGWRLGKSLGQWVFCWWRWFRFLVVVVGWWWQIFFFAYRCSSSDLNIWVCDSMIVLIFSNLDMAM